MFRGIRLKLSLVTFILVALITGASSFIVVNIMDRFMLDDLIQKGFSLGRSAATVAAYSMLNEDRLALDNLSAKLKDFQDDVKYVAVVDNDGRIIAHSRLGMSGRTLDDAEGEAFITKDDGAEVITKRQDGEAYYEFRVPVRFAEKRLGEVLLGLGLDEYVRQQAAARKKIALVSVVLLLIGAVGVFFLSAFITTPIQRLSEGVSRLARGEYAGEIRPVSRDELGELTRNFNEMARLIMEQKSGLERHARELEDAYIAIVKVIAAAIDARDPYTLGHSARVASLSRLMGERLGLGYEELKELEMACLFHDVGKIRTPDHILHKNGRLEGDEYLIMMKHPEDGAEILRLVESLHRYIPAVLHHHEWYDGSGYPAGLKGEEIPLFASIIAITDAYDAMTTSRPYRETRTKDEAIAELKDFSGTQFVPHLIDIFVEVLNTSHPHTVNSFLEG